MACPELSLFGGFAGIEGNIGCQILGGLCPPNLNIGPPPAPTPLVINIGLKPNLTMQGLVHGSRAMA